MQKHYALTTAVLVSVAAMFGTARAASPADTCRSAKHKEAGNYAFCRQKAEAQFATKGDASARTAGHAACASRFDQQWAKHEAKASAKGGACPSLGDVDAIRGVIDEHSGMVATALAGEGLQGCPIDLAACSSDRSTCSDELASCDAALTSAEAGFATCTSDLDTCNDDLVSAQSTLAICTGDLDTCLFDASTVTADLEDCMVDLDPCENNLYVIREDIIGCEAALSTCNAALPNCENSLTACQATPEGQRAQTGQTSCYNTAASVACAGTGQDGELLKGLPPAFIDNGDGTISDQRTGLQWEKLSDDASLHAVGTLYTWTTAISTKIAGLNAAQFAGYNDWRLPNVAELTTLRHLGTSSPAVHSAFHANCTASCTVQTCSCSNSSIYWSSTTHHNTTGSAWTLSFIDGVVGFSGKGATAGVRAVRGGIS